MDWSGSTVRDSNDGELTVELGAIHDSWAGIDTEYAFLKDRNGKIVDQTRVYSSIDPITGTSVRTVDIGGKRIKLEEWRGND